MFEFLDGQLFGIEWGFFTRICQGFLEQVIANFTWG